MGKPISLIGGILALAGVVGSLFLSFLGWYVEGTSWTNAIGGGGTGSTATYFPSPIVILEFLPGIIAILGVILCFIPKKLTCILGSIFILGGVILFLVNYYLAAGDFSFFWGTTGHVGYGLMGTAFGGLVALIGSFIGKKD